MLITAEKLRADAPARRERIGKIGTCRHGTALEFIVLRDAVYVHFQIRHRKPPTHADIGRGEPCTLHADRRSDFEIGVHPRIRRIGAGNDRQPDGKPDERRMPVAVENDVCFADLKPLLLEYQVGEEIAEFGGEDADTRATMTSLIQWRLFSCRVTPVRVASV